ncbi:hypothetical protein [Ensifer sp. B1-9]|uniref:hypothetical protein n=1 Tax=Ensifer sp. B1-9 TaxID=3141455 RepID=UPI003D23E36C
MNILQACQNPEIFAPWFRKPETYLAWHAFLAAMFGLPMTEEQLDLYRKHTGRSEPPTEAQREAWMVIGRRGGKSFHMALIAVYLACFFDYREYLAPGERATVLVIATDRRQARVILRYVRAMLDNIDVLKDMVERDTADSFDLDNFTTIEVGTASFRSTRGYTYAAVLCDELAFWRTDDAAEPDYAILDAIRPGMASIPTSMLLCASSPHARRGALWDAFKRYWGKDDAPLVWKATTREMNPTISQSVVDRALERDHASAMAEYGAEFRADIEDHDPKDIVSEMRRQEVRAWLRTLKPEERTKAVRNASDPLIKEAALSVPAEVSGLLPSTRDDLTRELIEARYGDEIAALNELDEAVSTVERAVDGARDDVREALGMVPHDFNAEFRDVEDEIDRLAEIRASKPQPKIDFDSVMSTVKALNVDEQDQLVHAIKLEQKRADDRAFRDEIARLSGKAA